VHQTVDIFAVICYFPTKKRWKECKDHFEHWLKLMMSKKPRAVWVICGDFNTDIQRINKAESVHHEMTYFRTIQGRLVESTTDWMMGNCDLLLTSTERMNLSDHVLYRVKIS
jgi:hypothetical protein